MVSAGSGRLCGTYVEWAQAGNSGRVVAQVNGRWTDSRRRGPGALWTVWDLKWAW